MPDISQTRTQTRSELRFLTCGSVDDGKSTLIGRLINDATGLFDDQIKALKEDSRRFGTTGDDIDFALLLDGLEAEREQGITIDVAYRFFATARRAFIVADTPGHQQYTRNMATGASNAELAVLLVDARKGLVEQTRRHAAIVSLLGIRDVVLAVNKIDLVEFSETCFRQIEQAFQAFAAPLGFRSLVAIPLSARLGDNVAKRSTSTAWYVGPVLLDHLETVETAGGEQQAPFRFPVQWVNRPDSEFRGFSGMIAAGQVTKGDSVVVASSGRTSRIARIVSFDGDLPFASVGRSVTLTLADEIDVTRGDLLAEPRRRPSLSRRFAADLVWMDEAAALQDTRYLLKIATAMVPATITQVVDRLQVDSLEREPATELPLNGIGRVNLETAHAIAWDAYQESRQTGCFILIDRSTCRTVAAGMIVHGLDTATDVHRQAEDITPTVRAAAKGQKPAVVWLTGLPSSGKSTIANIVERRLVALGRQTMLLDGDNLRQGLNADLGFDAAARSENVRRVGEVAKLMVDAGLIVLVALVSPFRADRDRAAALVEKGQFIEVFVDAPPEICQQRDPKGLYAKAASGKVANMTGQAQRYEPPLDADLELRTDEITADEAADRIIALLMGRI